MMVIEVAMSEVYDEIENEFQQNTDIGSTIHLTLITAYSLIIIGVVGVILNGFLFVFLLYNLIKRRIIAQKIVYINLAVADFIFALIACTIRGPGLFIKHLFDNRPFCVTAVYLISYMSKVDLLVVVPITLSIYIITVYGFERCTTWFTLGLCSISWLVPALYLAAFTIKGHFTPDSFYIAYINTSHRCDFTGTAHPDYLLSQSILFFYLPTGTCALLYGVIGYYQIKYRVTGVGRLVGRGCFVTLFYCLCWLPFMVVSSYIRGSVSNEVFVFTYLFYYFSVIVNPITYTLTSRFFMVRIRSMTLRSRSYSSPAVLPEGVINVVPGGEVDSTEAGVSAGQMITSADGLM